MMLKTRTAILLSCLSALGVGFAAGKYERALRERVGALVASDTHHDAASRPVPVVTPPLADPSGAPERPAADISIETLQTLADLDQGQAAFIADLRRATKVPVGVSAETLRQQALAAAQQGEISTAISKAEEAVALGDTTLWLALAGWKQQNQEDREALRFAWQGYHDAANPADKAAALQLIGAIFADRNRPELALAVWQEAQKQAPDAATQRKIDLQTGKLFAVIRLNVQAEQDNPAVCAEFPVDLVEDGSVDYRSYVTVTPARKIAVFPQGKTLCVEGLDHNGTYTLLFRSGLPGAGGGKLETDHQEQVTLTARPPFLAFPDKTYILPRHNNAGVPVMSVNLDRAELRLLRIVDRNLLNNLSQVGNRVWEWNVNTIRDDSGEEVWRGTLAIPSVANRQVRTAIPLQTMLPDTAPGVYLLTAAMPAEIKQDTLATQWLVVTDIGLSSMTGADGIHLNAQSYATGKPLAGVRLQLLARNNKLLAETVTDANGRASFAPGYARATGGNTPYVVMAYGDKQEFTYLELTRPAFDLADRGVSGREMPKGLDAFLYADRDIYRPGETVQLVTLVRDVNSVAPENLPPLTLRLLRPDGVVFTETQLRPDAARAGGYHTTLPIPATARMGRWQVMVYVDPKAAPVGTLDLTVEDFVPAKLSVKLASDAASITPGAAQTLAVQADYLYGAAGANLAVKGELTIRKAEQAFTDYPRYRFGAVDDSFTDQREELLDATTDAAGKATLTATLPTLTPTSLPLAALIRASVFEEGGRPTSRTMILPIRKQDVWIGLEPQFDDSIDEGGTAAFKVVTLDADGKPSAQTLRYQLLREEYDYVWYGEESYTSYRRTLKTRLAQSGSLATDAVAPSQLTFTPKDYGTYRLEVFVPGKDSKVLLSSVRFQVGWSSDTSAEVPDTLKVMADRQHYRPGETARLTVASPFTGPALLTVAREKVVSQQPVMLQKGDNNLSVTASDAWGNGVYALVTAFRPGTADGGVPAPAQGAAQAAGPGRAIGLTWLGIDPAPRTLAITLETPETIEPEQTLTVPVTVTGAAKADTVFVTLAAVDEGVLQLTDFKTPDPEAHFYGKRRLAVDLRDSYGKLIDTRYDAPGTVRSGGDAAGRQATGLPDKWIKPLALFSGIVALDADGRAAIPLPLPQFNGKVRLMATAWSAASVGHADKPLIVRAPVVLTTSLPRFFAVGDESQLTITARNVAGPAGVYTLTLATTGGIGTDFKPASLTLAANGEARLTPVIKANALGRATLTATLTGPDGRVYQNAFTLTVRPTQPLNTKTTQKVLKPGESLTLDRALWQGQSLWQASARISASSTVNFGMAGLLEQLDRYPYGCLEQTLSRALPLLYVEDIAKDLGLKPERMQAGIQQAGVRLGELQKDDGAFGLWSSFSPDEPWLTAYAADFLQRADAQGHSLPPFLRQGALDWLKQKVVEANYDQNDLSMYAYAFYVLAKARMIDPAAVRYFYDAWFAKLPNLMAKAHLATALVLAHDEKRADAAFGSLYDSIGKGEAVGVSHYGSPVSDLAAVVALSAEAGIDSGKLLPLAQKLAALKASSGLLTTQEQAWLIAANHAVLKDAKPVTLMQNTTPLPAGRLVTAAFAAEDLAQPVTLRNAGEAPVLLNLQQEGYPEAALPAVANGFAIQRRYFTLDGQPLEVAQIRQNEMVVALIEGETTGTFSAQQAVVVDLLPAGFEIENPAFGNSKAAEELSWLPEQSTPAFQDRRDDRYVAALTLGSGEKFALAYLVRAVTPGTYVLPPVMIEDLYHLDLLARTLPGRITVAPAR